MYYLYMLECSNGAFYTGYTTDIVRRFEEHKQGSPKCKYTRSFPPKKIAACWQVEEDISLVLQCEHAIKKMSKHMKATLVESPEAIVNCLALNVPAGVITCCPMSQLSL